MTADLRAVPRHLSVRRPRPVEPATVQGTLALDYGPALRSSRGPELHLVPGEHVELEAFTHRFARGVVEVLSGDRGPAQLLRWTSDSVYGELQQRAALLARTVPGDRRVRRLRSQVVSVHLYRPDEHAAEISIHVRQGQRSRAIAARLDLVDDRWICTALVYG